MPSLMNMEKNVMVGSCTVAVIGLLFFMETTTVMGIDNSTDSNCISIQCLKEKLKRMCKEGSAPSYLDCKNTLRCINAGEQEITRCAKAYLLTCLQGLGTDLLCRDWCRLPPQQSN